MNKPILLAILLLVNTYVKSQEKNAQRLIEEVTTTLVNNQLSPEILKIEQASGFTKGKLNPDNGNTINQFQQSTFAISAFPFTIVKKQNTQLFMGLGYQTQIFNQFATMNADSVFAKNIQSAYLGTALIIKYNNHIFWQNYLQTGFYGRKPFENVDKTFNIQFVSKLNYKPNRDLNYGIGLAYFSNMGEPLILPAVSVTYSQPHWLIDVNFPIKTEIEGIMVHGILRPVAGISYHGGNYYLSNNQYLYNFGALGYLGMRFKLMDMVYMYSAYQVGVFDAYKFGTSHQLSKLGNYSGQSQFVISLNIQAPTFIPRLQH
ncbi:DUF6268 family outer membrane beta-barrel protein [Parasediminibacterium paludis]|uniref:DUF6268 family outer membrane beta-barrel protein n=1 Tax=Parasediminibacterium paludis TaxID=908966 RepID=A0ABV8PWW2_9BACT